MGEVLLTYLSWRDFQLQLQIAPFPLPSTISYLRDSHNIGDLLMNLLTNGLCYPRNNALNDKTHPSTDWTSIKNKKYTETFWWILWTNICKNTSISLSLSRRDVGCLSIQDKMRSNPGRDTVSCLQGYSLSIQFVFLQAWCIRMCRWRYTCTCTGRYSWKCKLAWICVHHLHGRVLLPIVFKRYLISKGNFIF